MLSAERIQAAGEFVEWLRLAVHEKQLTNVTDRMRASAGCLAIAQDHHHAIVFLIQNRLYASSFALLRLAFEAYVRGEWLAHCATELQVNEFISGNEPPSMNVMLTALECTPAFDCKVLSRVKTRSWSAMCAYTHTGGLHIQRWVTADGIEPNYADDEIEEVLTVAEIIGPMAVLGVAGLAGDVELAKLVYEKVKARSSAEGIAAMSRT